MRITNNILLLVYLPLVAGAQQFAVNTATQNTIYTNIPTPLQTAGVKWVNDIYKDGRGLMWFATNNGLFRFDGTNVLYIRTRVDDSTTLPSNEVISVTGDKEGNIWAGTARGGALIDPNNLTCTRIKDYTGYTPGFKFKFFVDSEDNVWGETDAGLYEFDRQKKCVLLVWSSGIGEFYGTHAVISTASWGKDELVVGTLSDVVFVNKRNFSFHRVSLLPDKTEVDVSKIYVDDDNELWVGTWNLGLFHFNKASGQFNRVKWQNNIPANALTAIPSLAKVRVNGNCFLYMGLQDGLARIQLQNDCITPTNTMQSYFTHTPNLEGSIPGGSINVLHADELGYLWVGCGGDEGIARISLSQSQTYTLPVNHHGNVQEINRVTSAGKTYFAICSWHGTTGLHLLNDSLSEIRSFERIPASADHDAVNVSAVNTDSNGRFWISSWRGITVMDDKLHQVRVLDHNTRGQDTLYKEKNNFLLISNDTVWIASYKRGIDLFTTGFKRLKHYNGDDHGLLETLIWKFYRGRDGTVWLVGNAFLYRFDASKDEFIPYYFSKDKSAYNPVDVVERKDGSLLVATSIGLVSADPRTGSYYYINSPLLEREEDISSVCLDDADNAWFTTAEHLVHYEFATNIFTLYGKQDGIDVADGLYTVRYAGNNRLLIGQYNKITVFTALSANRQIKAPGLIVTGVYVNDSLVNSGLPGKGLRLSYSQNKINIAFACVNYNRPEQNIYAYRLKNVDTTWTFTRLGTVTYANLAPGAYTFEVKAANYARTWSQVSAFTVNILPPFWQSWWFRLLALAIIASATYAVFRWRVGNIRKEEKNKTDLNRKMAALEMKALRAQMNPHFVFNSLSSIQESIVTGKTEAASKYLSKFSKLIRLILENSGKQYIAVKTEIELLSLYLELESFRFENFTYTFSIDPGVDANFTMIPNMVIQPFVENALKHGLSKKKHNKHLKIDIHHEKGLLYAIVEDNGVGRKRSAEMKSADRTDHHSMGINITEERLRLLSTPGAESSAEIIDLYDKEGNPSGTLVKIILPVET